MPEHPLETRRSSRRRSISKYLDGQVKQSKRRVHTDGDLEYHVRYSRGSLATNDYEEFGYIWTRNPAYYDFSTGEYVPAPGFTTQDGVTYGVVQRWADDESHALRYHGVHASNSTGSATYSGTGVGYYARGTAHGHMLTDVSSFGGFQQLRQHRKRNHRQLPDNGWRGCRPGLGDAAGIDGD